MQGSFSACCSNACARLLRKVWRALTAFLAITCFRPLRAKEVAGVASYATWRQCRSSRDVCRVDPQRNLLFVAGSLPGPQGCWVYVRDAKRKRASELQIVPFPTYVGEAGEPTQAKPKKNKYDEYKA